jgi:uncharacterized membrane protein YbaN (DUF454 family)
MENSDKVRFEKKGILKVLLIISGTVCVALGCIGIFVPVLPTTPFLLLAAICYSHSSEKFYTWLLTNRWFGDYIRNYREGRGIPLKQKVYTISLLWIVITVSVIFAVPLWWVRTILLVIAAAVTFHLIRIKTLKTESNTDQVQS